MEEYTRHWCFHLPCFFSYSIMDVSQPQCTGYKQLSFKQVSGDESKDVTKQIA
jgi:hypothetical protein